METIYLTDQTLATADSAVTIGFFDGVHRGHRYLLEQLRRRAGERGLRSVAVTFDRHPRQVLQADWQPRLLTTLDEKEALLAETGIDRLVVLRFDRQMADLTALQFMQQVLRQQIGARLLLTGYDNRFGHRTPESSEGYDDYVGYGREMGIDVVQAEPLLIDGEAVSSSRVRRLLIEGRVDEAASCLGRAYALEGTVGHGEQMGHRLGFPTANLILGTQSDTGEILPRLDTVFDGKNEEPRTGTDFDGERLIPRNGVYAVLAVIRPRSANPTILPGMTNIGTRPTFDGHQQTIETHIFGFNGDLYGQPIRIVFQHRLRDERHFDSPQDLARQMELDAQQALQLLTSNS